ncbi:protein EARLY FLOWERING 3-like [Rhododendron vialii]|uniref:protein EARLY FLOWERING 3-like n=1 Tax=Rhododendron vialii TaxID=182163 RepID=UPI00265E3F6D|nr:protein EARLY FLOWERING 3-like [Rhododendron vialii]XP_058192560.1 protein EARLY FLOWERING 3-like [Rhododendron vialii]XP_058192561.1 protein EARLY FLOWERING 3-like [Rhododendron vialii]
MMKGGKDEEKLMGPLFPRLHIKDAEQGGPKAPPRNKMALYEQLSIPSQKFNSGSASMSPFPPNNSGNSVPSVSSSHGGGHKRSLYSPICNSPAPSHLPERLPSYSSNVMNLRTTSTNLEWKPMKPPKHRPLNGAYCSLFQPPGIAYSKNSSTKELPDEIDYTVPTFVQFGRTLECASGDKGKGTMVPFKEEKRGSLVDEASRIADSNGPLHHQNRALEEKKALRNDSSADPKKGVRRGNASMLEGVSCFRPMRGDNYRRQNSLENVSKCFEDQCGPLQVGELDRNADVSETSMVDSMSGAEISPDDVVGVIGQKQFLKTRRAIAHQQRVFAVQVFELHRLIKVQKLIAASPELLLQSELHLGKSSIKGLPTKKLPSGNLLEAPPQLLSKLKPEKPIHNTECAAENVLEMLLLPSLSNQSDVKLNTRKSTCYFHPPPGNQWLVPIISPSEGLVYKPFTGPTPPTSSFGVPVYGITTATHQGGIGILPGTPPLSHTYFPPYPMPSIPSVASSAVDGARQLTKSHLNGQEDKSEASSGRTERVLRGDALDLFPTDPTVKALDQSSQSCSNEQQTRVIKVVPHNPRSASESAARIFQSIQEERRQYT